MQATTSKVWLITGTSRGLGRAFTEAALEAGHQVVATAGNPQQLGTIVGKYGGRVRAVALDVTNEAQAQHAIHTAIEAFGGLDVLVNNAGYGNVCSVEDTSLTDFRAQIETNLFGVIIMTKAALPYFRERRAGHIIQITSIGGRIAPIGRAPYAAAKFGVEGFSESLYKEVGPLGIKVTLVEPGGFRTGLCRLLHGPLRRSLGVRRHSRRNSALSARLRRQAAGRPRESGGGASAHFFAERTAAAAFARKRFL